MTANVVIRFPPEHHAVGCGFFQFRFFMARFLYHNIKDAIFQHLKNYAEK